jgi:gliding-associated putative ABC transporter substrate-binding component GldG
MKTMTRIRSIVPAVLLSLAALVLLNIVAYFGFIRLDFTAGRSYSLSPASKRVLRRMDDVVLIRAVFSRELPDQYRFARMYVNDLLQEYRANSWGKVRFEFVDPTLPKAVLSERDVQAMGIMPVQFTQLAQNEYKAKKGYMGLAMLHGDRTEVIPVVENVATLEYDITSNLKKLTQTTRKTIGVITGHQEYDLSGEMFANLRRNMEKMYDFRTINPGDASQVDQLRTADALLVISPKFNYTDKELFALDQAIVSGVPAAFLMGTYTVDVNRGAMARRITSNVFDLLAGYGVRVLSGMVAEHPLASQQISIRTREGGFLLNNIIPFPLLPIISEATGGINRASPIVKDLNRVVLPFVSPLEINADTASITVTTLLRTTPASTLKKDLYIVNPMMTDLSPAPGDPRGPFVVAAEVTGRIKSYFDADRIKSLDLPATAYAQQPLAATPEGKTARIIVVGTGEQADQEALLLANVIDGLAQDYDLLAIRSKQPLPQQLRPQPPAVRLAYQWLITLALPLLVIAYGIIRWQRRRTQEITLP